MSDAPAILLSFDLEEFDIPLEYGGTLSLDEQLDVTTHGCTALLDMLDRLDVTATFFITGVFADARHDLLQRIAAKHEVASHGLEHSNFQNRHLAESRELLQRLTDQPVTGFRRARLADTDSDAIRDAGYTYDSSINPTYLPGRYNHLSQPRSLHQMKNGLWQLPISTMPYTRFPLFWLSLKNLPLPMLNMMARLAIKHDGYLNTFAHPWEFADLSKYTMLPGYVRRRHGQPLLERYAKLIKRWKTWGEFCVIQNRVSA